jgi:hypothetical protein
LSITDQISNDLNFDLYFTPVGAGAPASLTMISLNINIYVSEYQAVGPYAFSLNNTLFANYKTVQNLDNIKIIDRYKRIINNELSTTVV